MSSEPSDGSTDILWAMSCELFLRLETTSNGVAVGLRFKV